MLAQFCEQLLVGSFSIQILSLRGDEHHHICHSDPKTSIQTLHKWTIYGRIEKLIYKQLSLYRLYYDLFSL